MVIRVGHTGEQGKRIISVNRNGEREHKEENKDIGKRKEETMDFGGQAQDQIYDLWLCSFPGWSNNARCRLAQAFGGARSAYFASSKEWEGILSPGQAESLRNFTNQWRLEEEYESPGDSADNRDNAGVSREASGYSGCALCSFCERKPA